jgi:Ca-activated chloride channel family protein
MKYRILSVLLLFVPSVSQAGIIFFPGRLDDGKYVRDADNPQPCYAIQYSTIAAENESGRLRVRIQETIAGPDQPRRAVGLVPLPEAADLSGAAVTVGRPNERGKAAPGVVALSVTAAQRVYESIARETGSTKILALTGHPALLIPELQLDGKLDIGVTFTAPVDNQGGLCAIACPLPATAWTRGPVERLSLSVAVRSSEPLRAMFSPTHTAAVERRSLREATVRLKAEGWSGDDEFRLLWVADRDAFGLRVLGYRAPGEDDGYFLLVGNPTGSEGGEKPLPKDVLFVLDTSGSMRGEKIEQARAAIDYCLKQLNPSDRFNIVTFGTEVASFREEPADRTADTVAAAATFVDGLVAAGRTNISGAVAKMLAGQARPDRPRIAIFLTDGTPTAGELVPERIVERVKQANTSGTRLFVLGLGHDVNAHLLDKLAEATDGSSEYVEPREEIDAKVAALYDRLSHPVLTNVAVDFGTLRTHAVYPQKLGVLFRGSEIMIAGRYRDGGAHEFSLSGTLSGKLARYVCRADLPRAAGSQRNEFVAPLWAARKIGYLLQEIRLHGENQELIAEVVRLSKQFGIVTEYTQFLAAAGGEMTTAAAVAEAKRQMNRANMLQAGQWAVNQAANDQALQRRQVAGNEANRFRDSRGKMVAANTVMQQGRRAFYLRDGQWVDGDEAGQRQTRVVKLFSPEYFQLLRTQPEFARAQQLGWAMSLNVGSERIVVEKDGRQKDEVLQKQQATERQQLESLNRQQNQMQLQQMPQLQNQMPRQNRVNQAPGQQ